MHLLAKYHNSGIQVFGKREGDNRLWELYIASVTFYPDALNETLQISKFMTDAASPTAKMAIDKILVALENEKHVAFVDQCYSEAADKGVTVVQKCKK
jgi:hypothetical protein